MTKQQLIVTNVLTAGLLLAACASTRLPDPGVRCPQAPAELMENSVRVQPIGNETE